MFILIWYTLIPRHQNYSTVRACKRREVRCHAKLETKTRFVFQKQIFFFISLYDSSFFLNENFISFRNVSWKATHSSVTLWQDDIVIDFSCKSFFRTNYVIYSHRLHSCSAHIHACGATLCFLFSLFLHERFFAAERTESWRTHAREKRGHIRREKEREYGCIHIHSLKQILSFAHSQEQHKVILFCVKEHLCVCIHLGTHLLCFFFFPLLKRTNPAFGHLIN